MYDELPDEAMELDGDDDVVAPLAPVPPEETVAFESMYDGPNGLLVDRERPAVDVEPVVPLPLVPTAPACSLAMMQPISFTSSCWLAALCDCAVERRVRVERVVLVVPLWVELPVVDVVLPDCPDEVRPV